MKNLKAVPLLVMLFGLMFCLIGCAQKQATQEWEYKVIEFSRDEHFLMESILKDLGSEGWAYAGPLCNNGINAQYVAFKRPK